MTLLDAIADVNASMHENHIDAWLTRKSQVNKNVTINHPTAANMIFAVVVNISMVTALWIKPIFIKTQLMEKDLKSIYLYLGW